MLFVLWKYKIVAIHLTRKVLKIIWCSFQELAVPIIKASVAMLWRIQCSHLITVCICNLVFVPWNWINMKCLIYAAHCFNYGNCQTNWLLIFKFSSTVIVSWISFTPTELQTFTHTLYYFQHKFTRNLAQESSHWGYSDYVVCLAKYQGIYIKISIENFLGPRPGVNFMRLSFCKCVTTALHMCQWKLQRWSTDLHVDTVACFNPKKLLFKCLCSSREKWVYSLLYTEKRNLICSRHDHHPLVYTVWISIFILCHWKAVVYSSVFHPTFPSHTSLVCIFHDMACSYGYAKISVGTPLNTAITIMFDDNNYCCLLGVTPGNLCMHCSYRYSCSYMFVSEFITMYVYMYVSFSLTLCMWVCTKPVCVNVYLHVCG